LELSSHIFLEMSMTIIHDKEKKWVKSFMGILKDPISISISESNLLRSVTSCKIANTSFSMRHAIM
jgi:hypothetical protein